jgi:L-alanine-DL-glutamate epimerase-like enolase superfamily enzyme
VAGWLAAFAAFPWPPSREPVPVNALVDATGVPVAVERALAAQGSGFRTLKLKVGGDPEADIERLRAVREAVGPAMEIRIDANGGWDEAGAARALAGAARANVALCEQPVARGPGACAAFARLRHIGIPLAADESCRSLPEFAAFLAAGAVDAVVVKPMASGLTEALTVCAVAHSSNCGVIVTSTFDAGPGTLMAMQLAAALPRPLAACGLATLDLLEHPLATGVPPIHAGLIDASALDESVIQLDDEALDRYAAGPWTEIPRI